MHPLIALTTHHLANLSLAVAVVALFFSGVSCLIAIRTDRRDRARHDRERRAELEVVAARFDDWGGKVRTYTVRVRNVGASVGRKVKAVIVDGEDPKPIGLMSHEFLHSDLTIPPGETVELEVEIGMGLLSKLLRFRLAWSDDVGDREADGPMCPRQFHPNSEFGPLISWTGTRQSSSPKRRVE